jgi:hypothetical protein
MAAVPVFHMVHFKWLLYQYFILVHFKWLLYQYEEMPVVPLFDTDFPEDGRLALI